MDHSAKKRHHEEARKKHKHDQQEHARELAKRPPSMLPRILLVGGLIALIAIVLFVTLN